MRIGFIAAAAAAGLAAAPAAALTYEVRDGLIGGGGWVEVAPIETADDPAAFYGFAGLEANPPFALVPGALQLFLHRDTTASGPAALSLGMVLSARSGGPAGRLDFTLSGAPATDRKSVV